jgi:hypothetical protein
LVLWLWIAQTRWDDLKAKDATWHWKDLYKMYKTLCLHVCFKEIMWFQSFQTLHVLILGVHFRIPKSFDHFKATSINNHNVYIIREKVEILVNYKWQACDTIWSQVPNAQTTFLYYFLLLVWTFSHVQKLNLMRSCWSHSKVLTHPSNLRKGTLVLNNTFLSFNEPKNLGCVPFHTHPTWAHLLTIPIVGNCHLHFSLCG